MKIEMQSKPTPISLWNKCQISGRKDI